MTKHIAIIGAGRVGSTIAYALCLKKSASRITLVDIDIARCTGEILDLNDAIPFSHTSSISAGDLYTSSAADIIIITAGRAQKPGESREQLINTNKVIIQQIMSELQPRPHAIIIIVTNPVDSLTYYAQSLSSLPRNQIIGSGTLLDSQRLKQILAHHTHVSPRSITALILGQHGDAQFPLWSGASIQGLALEQFGITQQDKKSIFSQVRAQAYEIITCKGSTYYGIATCIASLCETILFDLHQVVPVSCFIKEFDICASLPVVLNKKGIHQILLPKFTTKEEQDFDRCIGELQKTKQMLTIK